MFSWLIKLSDNPIKLYQNIEIGNREESSFKKLEKLTNKGDAGASYFLALCYVCGQVVKKDRSMFVKYLLKSVEGNYPIALARIGDCYYKGEDLEQNRQKGIEYWKKAIAISDAMDEDTAIENGVGEYFISTLHYNLFRHYHEEEKNIEKAFCHLERASKCHERALLELAI